MVQGINLFSFYGRKYKIIGSYPQPRYNLIIEPFAGSASYSYKYNDKDVLLFDKDERLIRLWKFLINATSNQILELPSYVENGQAIPQDEKYCREQLDLMGFCCNNGSAVPKKTSGRMNFNSWHRDRLRIAADISKIRHWQAEISDYRDMADYTATWFIDPPYQFQGHYYKHHKIDYKHLAEWCMNRKGQVIVCENSNANWLPFRNLKEISGQRHRTMEVIWTND
jgi:site-specific DNA-adenine methylase